ATGEGEEVGHQPPDAIELVHRRLDEAVCSVAPPELLHVAPRGGERVADLVGDARRRLAERGELLCTGPLARERADRQRQPALAGRTTRAPSPSSTATTGRRRRPAASARVAPTSGAAPMASRRARMAPARGKNQRSRASSTRAGSAAAASATPARAAIHPTAGAAPSHANNAVTPNTVAAPTPSSTWKARTRRHTASETQVSWFSPGSRLRATIAPHAPRP